ncbi:flagellin-like protein [Methanomicrobium sp. W14]|uniref:type IV pilin N-terminal domain-containing protein n=1 Tax=Methanomicrobium sp. W14 TaxID=2817839 RepID=UPI001AE89E84|nr:type IV pilin N-terminal domain-containing protein [Methanomicrobium sp. W14]MBP2133477.1 flagellin-like protein [Methanomicrobium sp. W14]
MKNLLQKEEGVSPVIGVMLMIVVTVIIAAAVSAFATGLSDTSADTPVANFEFKVYSHYVFGSTYNSGTTPYLEARLKSGEAINTENLKIISHFKYANGTEGSHEFIKSNVNPSATSGTKNVFMSFSGPGNELYFGDTGSYWHTGDKFTGGVEYVLGIPEDETKAGDKIDIDMVYKPTNTIIWSDEVTVI